MFRLGIIDFDSSHAVEFTKRFNHVGMDADQVVEGARVVAGWPGTSVMSPERIPGFTEQILNSGVELVDSPEKLLGKIDAILVLSVCGTPHLQRVRPFLEAGIPAFVDKPFACSLNDAREMQLLASQNNTMLFSSSGMRYSDSVLDFQQQADRWGRIEGIVTHGPGKRAEGNPGLFHYGIHATEVLFTLMGPGCVEVTTMGEEQGEVATGRWKNGRLGTVRGLRSGATPYGFLAFCEQGVVHQTVSTRYAYRNLCREIVNSLETGKPSVPLAQTLEIVAFIEAALQSESQGGSPVPLAPIEFNS